MAAGTTPGVISAQVGEVNKIDFKAVNGLEGVEHSLGYIVNEIEKHFHNREWFLLLILDNHRL